MCPMVAGAKPCVNPPYRIAGMHPVLCSLTARQACLASTPTLPALLCTLVIRPLCDLTTRRPAAEVVTPTSSAASWTLTLCPPARRPAATALASRRLEATTVDLGEMR